MEYPAFSTVSPDWSERMFAQSMVDYGTLGSIASRVESLAYSVRSSLGNLSPTTWLLIAIGVVVVFFFSRR